MKEECVCYIVGSQSGDQPVISNESENCCSLLKEMLRDAIEAQIKKNSITRFLSPMNTSTELCAAEIIETLQTEGKNITLTAILPYELQSADLPEDVNERFIEIILRCNKEKHVQKHFEDMFMVKTARMITDVVDSMIAIWNGTPDDVGIVVHMAEEKGIPLTVIVPE